MPVFHKGRTKILYLHVPKTGGSAIEIFFEKNGYSVEYLDRSGGHEAMNMVRRCSPQHLHAAVLREILRLDRFAFIFMTVRDPFARIVSEYKMRLHDNPAMPPFRAWLEEQLRTYHADPFVLDNHIRPQAEFWMPGARVFRLEDGFGPDFVAELEGFLGITFADRTIDHVMRFDDVKEQRIEVDPKSRALLSDFYHGDFARFGY
jgi:hypothetical protein